MGSRLGRMLFQGKGARRRLTEAKKADAPESCRDGEKPFVTLEAAEDELTKISSWLCHVMESRDAFLFRAEEAERLVRAYQAVFDLVLDPAHGETCVKVKCISRADAEEHAREIEPKIGLPPKTLTAYHCQRCGLQPRGRGRWWHVTNVDPARRGRGKFRNQRSHQLTHSSLREQLAAREKTG